MATVVIGMSGGVDSSVAALLLKRQEHNVVGVFMNNWEETASDGVCSAEQDFADVRAVCDVIGIPYYSVNLAAEYKSRVFSEFLSSYAAGYTPNPDVLCNREIKFDAFLTFAKQLGAQSLATGHFARIERCGGEARLLRGSDDGKDQTYFLHALSQAQLMPAMFPVGGLTKREVRQIAVESGLPTARKKDSTGICFIGERDFREFLSKYLPAKPGDVIDTQGNVIGRHEGCMGYTVGQRKGLGIGGGVGDGRAWFVLHKDVKRNLLIAAQGDDHPALWSNSLVAVSPTFISGTPPMPIGEPFRCTAKLRYRQPDQACEFTCFSGHVEVRFDQPQRAISPGQSIVFYIGEVCLGGAVIARPAQGPAAAYWS